MAEFTDISSSLGSAAVFQDGKDFLLFGFNASEVESDTPPNTIEFTFSDIATLDVQLIAEYSAGGGVWKPLAYTDTTDGFTGQGAIHFEIPRDWSATSQWDESTDVGGGSLGSGPTAYWIRLQRRNLDSDATGATTSSVGAKSRPFVVAKRNSDRIFYDYTTDQVGQAVYFRFVPVGKDGVEYFEQEVRVGYTIQGSSIDPGNAL